MKQTYTFRITLELHARLKAESVKRGLTISDLLEELILAEKSKPLQISAI